MKKLFAFIVSIVMMFLLVTPVAANEWDYYKIDPTCTLEGYDVKEYVPTGEQWYTNYIPAFGHDFGEWDNSQSRLVNAPSNCTDPVATCETCGWRGYLFKWDIKKVEPTCEADGYLNYIRTPLWVDAPVWETWVYDFGTALGHNFTATDVIWCVEHKCDRCGWGHYIYPEETDLFEFIHIVKKFVRRDFAKYTADSVDAAKEYIQITADKLEELRLRVYEYANIKQAELINDLSKIDIEYEINFAKSLLVLIPPSLQCGPNNPCVWDNGVVVEPKITLDSNNFGLHGFEMGYTLYTCLRCKNMEKHDYVNDFYFTVPPNCTQVGYTARVIIPLDYKDVIVFSNNADIWLGEYDYTADLGHTWGELDHTQMRVPFPPSSCCDPVAECLVCGWYGYLYSWEITPIEPTCLDDGYTEYINSAGWKGCIYDEGSALGHLWGELDHSQMRVPFEPEQCCDPVAECLRCGWIGYLNSWDIITVDPTCTADGYTKYINSAGWEGCIYDEDSAPGHSFTSFIWDVDDWYASGCSVCGHAEYLQVERNYFKNMIYK